MAKCKNCGTDIPEGAEYCEECLSKLNTAKDSESYLDSLLNAVMTEEPKPREIVFPKREASSLVSVSKKEEAEPKELEIKELESEEFEVNESVVTDDELQTEEDVVEEEAFDMFFDGKDDLPDLKSYSIFDDFDEGMVERMLAEDLQESSMWEEELRQENVSEDETPLTEYTESVTEDVLSDMNAEADEPAETFDGLDDLFEMFGSGSEEEGVREDVPDEEISEDKVLEEETVSDDMLSGVDFFAGVDMMDSEMTKLDMTGVDMADSEVTESENVPENELDDFFDLFGGTEETVEESTEESVPLTEFGDFADLFGSGDAEEFTAAPESSDNITDLFAAEESTSSQDTSEHTMDDFADLFSGLDGLDGSMFEFGAEPEELDAGEEVLLTETVSEETKSTGESLEADSKKKRKEKKEKKEKGGVAALYHKLFDNVKVDPSKIKQPPTKEEIEAKKKEKQEAKERSKEEKEALLAEKKEQENQVKQEKLRKKKEAAAEKKARKMEEAKLLLEEMEQTRINRAGASIVFIFFAMIAVLVIVGTSIYSYSLSIRNAEYEFNRDEYTLAYNEIYGLEIKDEDIVLYDRIMTVMYVQKQLNSYYNYYGLNDKPKALDSLLKGLKRYEKYIELAVDLDVDTDLDSVRKKILTEISTAFLISEQEAMEIIQSDSQVEYSQRVYDAVERLEK